MLKNNKYRFNFVKQAGFSLIELMIAIPLGLLVTYTVAAIYLDSIRGAYLQNDFSRVQENGRMAIELISRDIRGADYWGCVSDSTTIHDNLDHTDPDYATSMAADLDFSGGVTGNDNVTSATIGGVTVLDNTDTLTLRGANSLANVRLGTPYMTSTAANVKISIGSGIDVGDIILLSDCESAELFSTSSGNADTSGTLNHNDGNIPTAGAVNNATKDFLKTYEGDAQILIPYVKTYFLGTSAGVSTFYRQDNGGAPIELVRGITDLQLTYQDNSLSVGQFSDASAVNMNEVRVINVDLESQSNNASITKDYRVSVNIRNRTLQ